MIDTAAILRQDALLDVRRTPEGWHVEGEQKLELTTPPLSPGAGEPLFARWSFEDGSVEVRSDPLGFLPVFYASTQDRFTASTSLVPIIRRGVPLTLDVDALASFLRLGFFLGEDTPFQEIRAVPPNAVVTWRDGQTNISRRGYAHPGRAALTRRAALDGYVELFRESLRRRTFDGSPVAVPLSGGRDSRHILFELVRSGRSPDTCVTLIRFPPWGYGDVPAARQVAKRLDVPLRELSQRMPRFRAEEVKNELTHFCADEHAWFLPLVSFLREGFTGVFDGIAGDVLSAGHFLDGTRVAAADRGAMEPLLDLIFPRNPYLPKLLKPQVVNGLSHERGRERLRSELKYHLDAANPVGSFYFWNRTRREIALAPFSLLGRSVPVHAPYLDRDLVAFLRALPAEMLVDHRFHTDAIARGHPEWADIPYHESCTRPRGIRLAAHALGSFAPYGVALARRALRQRPEWIELDYLLPKVTADLVRNAGKEIDGYGPLVQYLLQLDDLTGALDRHE